MTRPVTAANSRRAAPRALLLASLCAVLTAPGTPTARDLPIDPVAALARDLAAGGRPLTHTPTMGYLPDLLQRLQVSEDSQVLVFSRTSLQAGDIGPANPRAIYFSDTVSIAYVPGAPLLELWAVGRDGAVRFYSLANRDAAASKLPHEDPGCSLCHAARQPTAPGPMTLSVTTRPDGEVLRYGLETDARTPIADRWGGWYVTGAEGGPRHRGNTLTAEGQTSQSGAGQTLASLKGRFDPARYGRQTSDIVALMTLEHETGFLNHAANLRALAAAPHDPAAMDAAINALADYMLGVGHAPLPVPVSGGSSFAEGFQARGPRDAQGRSLRDFDLQTRLFRYPLSYMIHTPAFDALPAGPKAALYARLADVLSGRDPSPRYQALSPADRRAALEILTATKPGLPPELAAAR